MLNHHIILHVNCRKTDQQWRAVRGYRRVFTAQKMKFSIKDFFSIWSHMLMKFLMENFIFCEVFAPPSPRPPPLPFDPPLPFPSTFKSHVGSTQNIVGKFSQILCRSIKLHTRGSHFSLSVLPFVTV